MKPNGMSLNLKEVATKRRSQVLRDQVCELAGRLGPGAKLPKVTELCRDMKVSPVTLNAVLHDLELEQLIVRKHAVGIFVSEKIKPRALNLALICAPESFRAAGHSPFWEILAERTRERAKVRNERLNFLFAVPREQQSTPSMALQKYLIEEIESGQIDGILGIGLPLATARWIESKQVPYVAFAGGAHRLVRLGSEKLAALGARSLADHGCSAIGVWSPCAAPPDPGMAETAAHQKSEFENVLQEFGLSFHPEFYRDLLQETLLEAGAKKINVDSHQEQGYRLAITTFDRTKSHRPDGLVICDDMMTHGALAAFKKLGLSPGKDVHIASHANAGSPILMGHDELLRIEYDPAEIADAMFDMLDVLISGQELENRVVTIAPRLRQN
jgi:DNA-binding LacI/PurR family transcriptional regulator